MSELKSRGLALLLIPVVLVAAFFENRTRARRRKSRRRSVAYSPLEPIVVPEDSSGLALPENFTKHDASKPFDEEYEFGELVTTLEASADQGESLP